MTIKEKAIFIILIILIAVCLIVEIKTTEIEYVDVTQVEFQGFEIVDKYYYVNKFGNYIYCIEIMRGGEMLQREISESEYNEIEVGDYWEE